MQQNWPKLEPECRKPTSPIDKTNPCSCLQNKTRESVSNAFATFLILVPELLSGVPAKVSFCDPPMGPCRPLAKKKKKKKKVRDAQRALFFQCLFLEFSARKSFILLHFMSNLAASEANLLFQHHVLTC